MATIRPARADELTQIWDVCYLNEIRNLADPPPPEPVPPNLAHILATGTMLVAEQDGRIIAFAAAITRSDIAFLTDLFVHPAYQSSRVGADLLWQTLVGGTVRCTISSNDPRAHALYIRAGMIPQWPHYNLQALTPPTAVQAPGDITISETRAGDPEFIRWDAEIGGRHRAEDFAYWAQQQDGAALWFHRGDQTIGYGMVRLKAWSFGHPDACTIGPIGVRNPANAAPCTLAAVTWARERASLLHINLPGTHPALSALLAGGFRITYVETFHSSAAPFFDPRCYLASGSGLL